MNGMGVDNTEELERLKAENAELKKLLIEAGRLLIDAIRSGRLNAEEYKICMNGVYVLEREAGV